MLHFGLQRSILVHSQARVAHRPKSSFGPFFRFRTEARNRFSPRRIRDVGNQDPERAEPPDSRERERERVRPAVSKESEKSLKPDLGLFSDSFETPRRTLFQGRANHEVQTVN